MIVFEANTQKATEKNNFINTRALMHAHPHASTFSMLVKSVTGSAPGIEAVSGPAVIEAAIKGRYLVASRCLALARGWLVIYASLLRD